MSTSIIDVTCPGKYNADGHGIVAVGFNLELSGDAQYPCTVLLCVGAGFTLRPCPR